LTSTPLQRVGPVAELPGLLDELGVSLEEAFAGSGIAPDDLEPEARLPYPALVGLLERSAAVARCPHLGLLLGARCDHRMLGVVGAMMASAPTLGDALSDYVGVQLGYSRGAVVYLQRSGEDYVLGYGLYDSRTGPSRQVHDLIVAIGCNVVRSLTGGRGQALRALECISPPESLSAHRSVLKTTVQFDQEQTAVVVSARDMALPLPGHDPARRLQLRTAIRQKMRGELADVAANVRHVLRPRLMLGEAGRDVVAADLGVSPRTLARQLARAGTSFEAIKDEVRFTVARELLALTRLPISRIGGALSYSTNSTFDHAFTRWAGTTPSQWRASNGAD
jgi:AraC-like DNA-binding protein